MNQVKHLQKLENLSYFDKNTLSQIINIRDKALYENIQRWIKSDILIQLKKGLYVTRKHLDTLQNKTQYIEFLANQLRTPSYLSMEYMLQKHGVLTESVFSYTSITPKSKRIYQNKLGTFLYRSINPKFFTGYKMYKSAKYEIYEASKEKALFDYLYLKFFRQKLLDKPLVDSLRLNLDDFEESEKQQFKEYCDLTGIKKYQNLPNILF